MEYKKGAIKMEMQFVCNAIDKVQIRKPHVDQSKELFACLFYFKKPEDTGSDGGLNIYRSIDSNQWGKGRNAVVDDIKVVDIPICKKYTCMFS